MPVSIDERPKTLRSGISLKPKYSVQHRSDMLIAEQMETVNEKLENLSDKLTELDNSKTEEDTEKLRVEVQGLKEKTDTSLMLLNILYKINHELKYARLDLEEALKHHGGDILGARKRVMWLEDRMGTLCGKVRLRDQVSNRPSHRTRGSTDRGGLTLTFRSGISDSEMSDDDNEFPTMRQKSLPPIRQMSPDTEDEVPSRGGGGRGRMADSPSLSGSEDYRDMQMRRPGLMDTPSSETSSSMSPAKMSYMQQRGPSQFSEYSEEEEVPQSVQPEQVKPQPSERSEEGSEGSEANDQVSELPSMFQRREFSGISRKSPEQQYQMQALPSAPAPSVPEPEEQEESKQDDEEPEDDEEERADEEEEKVKDESEETDVKKSGEEKEKKPGEEKTFITEISEAVTNKSRVTIVSPKREDTRQAFLREISEEERDLVMEYWQSEHHRFEYGDYADVLTQLDPLSYHQMGLAVPGSFLQKYDVEFEDLPWNVKDTEKRVGDITDIHKRALDKLALKVHRMYNKVFNATMLSVRPTRKSSDNQREISLLQSIDNSGLGPALTRGEIERFKAQCSNYYSTRDSSVTPSLINTKNGQSIGSVEPSRPGTIQTVATAEMPKMDKRRLGTSRAPPLVYYPKPIPPPEVLPLTRTTVGKEYPRLANSFTEPERNKQKPAVRIVDQRNLAQETKLTLYKERSRGRVKGPSTTEQKFRLMLETQKSASSSHKSASTIRPGIPRAMTKLSTVNTEELKDDVSMFNEESGSEASVWDKIKPKSRNREYSGLKWERVKTIVHTNFISTRAEERTDAAKQLGLLRCGDAMVFYALKEHMTSDESQRVRYEAAKSLILVGCWEDDVLQVILKYLVIGNNEIRLDLIKTMIDGKNVQYVNKSLTTFPELVKVLSHLSSSPDPSDAIALEAAVLLGRMCVDDDNAKRKLKSSLVSSNDTHQIAKSLEILVKQLNCTEKNIILSLLDLLLKSYVWKYRVLAAELFITIGVKNVCQDPEVTEKVYEVLEKRLWDEPTAEVRVASAKALAALGMFGKACEKVEKRLEDADEDIRTQAVISAILEPKVDNQVKLKPATEVIEAKFIGTLGMKNDKIIRLLLEMLELDASDYVRLMVVRTFVTLNSTDKRVLRALREREKAEGALGMEAKKAIVVLESLTQLPPPSPRRSAMSRTSRLGYSSMGGMRTVTQSI